MIAESYDRITDSPSRRIYEAVKQIPKGKVATYGQVAQMAGDKKMARAVGNALHKNPDPDSIPCYRVVNAKGELAGEFAFGGVGAQARLLKEDGVEVIKGKVNLRKYGITLPVDIWPGTVLYASVATQHSPGSSPWTAMPASMSIPTIPEPWPAPLRQRIGL